MQCISFSFLLLLECVFGCTSKIFLCMIYIISPRHCDHYQTYFVGHTKSVMFFKMSFPKGVTYYAPFVAGYPWKSSFTTSKKAQKTETRKEGGKWHRRFKNLQSTNRSEDKKNWVDKLKSLTKKKRYVVQKKKLIDT